MSASPPDTTPFAGTQRFQVLGPLGVGAMCVVHRARDRELGDIVALKTLKHLDHDSLYRLKQEFRALSAFDHPNLVSFYELLHSPEGWFVTMELVEGVDFLTWCRGKAEGDLSRARTLNTFRSATDLRFGRSAPAGAALDESNAVTEPIEALPMTTLPDLLRLRSSLRQLADGVQALHAGGRIHRDLKPSNVLISDAGRVVILDFGLVADINQDYTEGTLHQNIAGSAAYMSPEQAVGTALSEASDWYAVGVMLYEALTGRWPFSGSLYQILTLKNAMDPPPPSALVDGVPDDLEELCMALLQRDPEARPTGGEVLAALRNQEGGVTPKLLVPFRHRERELGVLRSAWAHVEQHGPACVVVRGARGSGRTQLVREFVKERNAASPELVTLKGRCFEWERLPYKALDGLMDNLARVLRRADTRRIQAIAREDLSFLPLLFPVIARAEHLDIVPAERGNLTDEQVAERAFAQLGRLVDVLADPDPVLAFVDDVHWGDVESAGVLANLLSGSRRRRLLLVVTAENLATSAFLNWLLPLLERKGVASAAIDMAPLSLEKTLELASAMLGEPVGAPVVDQLARQSGGLPGTLRELVRQRVTAATQDDDALDEVRVADIDGLPLMPRRLLEILAVARGPVPTEVAVVSGNLGEHAVNAVSTLRAHRLADVSGPTADALEIGSRAVMDYVEDHTPDPVRSQHHLALARAMEQAGSTDAVALATHFAMGGDRERAGTIAWLAANRSLEAGDWAKGAELLELALAHGQWAPREKVSMTATLGRTYALIGRPRDAARRLDEAAAEAPDFVRADLRRHLVEQQLALGDLAQALPALEALQASAGLPAFPKGLLAGGVAAWRRFQQRRRGQDFDGRLRNDVDAAELLKVDIAWTCAGPLALLDPSRAADYQPIHLTTALDVGEVERVMRALAEDVVLQVSRDVSADTSPLARVGELATRHRSAAGAARLAAAETRVAWLRGEVGQTAEKAPEAEVRARRAGLPAWERYQLRLVGTWARLEAGRVAEVGAQFEELTRDALHRDDPRLFLEAWGRIGARIAAATGRIAEARGRLRPAGEAGAGQARVWAALADAELLLAAGEERAALAAAEALDADAADPHLRTRIQRLRGLAARDAGDRRAQARATAALRKDDRPWALPWADLIDARYATAADRLRELGMGLDAALAGSRLDQGQSAAWLAERGVTHLEPLLRLCG